jgi:hypothetical protein
MIKNIAYALLILIAVACSGGNTTVSNQIDTLSEQQIRVFQEKLIRYIGKMPSQATVNTRFHSMFNEHYESLLQDHQMHAYYKNAGGKEYFLITRTAPSIKVKRVALGGFVVFDDKGEIKELAEIFRTWKKEPEELMPIAEMLFAKMVKGEDLSAYYPENSGDNEIIEFPNAETYYSIEKRTWISSRENPLDEFYQEKAKRLEEVMELKNKEIANDSVK